MKEIYHIDDLLLEKQKIKDTNYQRGFLFLITLLVLVLLFYLFILVICPGRLLWLKSNGKCGYAGRSG